MPNIYDFFNDRNSNSYIRPEDLDEIGIEVKIAEVTGQIFRQGEKAKPIIHFEGVGWRGITSTNRDVMVAEYGTDYDKWIGQVIRIKRGETFYGGKPVATVVFEIIKAQGSGT